MAIHMCKHVLTDAARHLHEERDCVGFGFGGDANASFGNWTNAIAQTPELQLSFKTPQFMFGIHRKAGDVMMGAGTSNDLEFFENTCDVPNREAQHDCMIMTWCYRAHARSEPVPLPARRPVIDPSSSSSNSSCARPSPVADPKSLPLTEIGVRTHASFDDSYFGFRNAEAAPGICNICNSRPALTMFCAFCNVQRPLCEECASEFWWCGCYIVDDEDYDVPMTDTSDPIPWISLGPYHRRLREPSHRFLRM